MATDTFTFFLTPKTSAGRVLLSTLATLFFILEGVFAAPLHPLADQSMPSSLRGRPYNIFVPEFPGISGTGASNMDTIPAGLVGNKRISFAPQDAGDRANGIEPFSIRSNFVSDVVQPKVDTSHTSTIEAPGSRVHETGRTQGAHSKNRYISGHPKVQGRAKAKNARRFARVA